MGMINYGGNSKTEDNIHFLNEIVGLTCLKSAMPTAIECILNSFYYNKICWK